MKKATKIALLVAAVCVGVGLALSFTAYAISGFDTEALFVRRFTPVTYAVDQPFDSLSVAGGSCDVRLLPSDDGTCRVDCAECDGLRFSVEVVGGVLTVRQEDVRKWYAHIGVFIGETPVTIYLPETAYERLSVQTASGNAEIPDAFRFHTAEVSAASGNVRFCADVTEDLTVRTASGNATLSGVTCGTLSVQTASGNAELTDVACGADANVRTTSGNSTLSGMTCGGTLTLRAASGDAELSDVTAERLDGETASGDLSLSACDAQTIRLQCASGDIHASLRSGKQFSAHSASGDVRVPESTPGAGTCELTTASGAIRVTVE